MLKNEKYVYETNEYKIINPNEGLQNDILNKLNEYIDEKGNVNLENKELLLYLLQLLIESNEEDYQFNQYTKEILEELENNPPQEYRTILYFLGNIISDIIINTYRTKILEVKQSHIELLQQQTINRVNEFNADLQMSVRNDKRIKDEKRVSEMRKDIEILKEIKINPIKRLIHKLKKNKEYI